MRSPRYWRLSFKPRMTRARSGAPTLPAMSITNSPRRRTALCGAILTLGLAGTSTFVATPALAASSWNTPIGVVKYLGSQTFPVDYTAGGVPVGGLSGLDYD